MSALQAVRQFFSRQPSSEVHGVRAVAPRASSEVSSQDLVNVTGGLAAIMANAETRYPQYFTDIHKGHDDKSR
jgi:hypothetical protein